MFLWVPNTLLSQNSRTCSGADGKSHLHIMITLQVTKFFLLSQCLLLSLSRRFKTGSHTYSYPAFPGRTPLFNHLSQPFQVVFTTPDTWWFPFTFSTPSRRGNTLTSFCSWFSKRFCFLLHFLQDFPKIC